MNNEDIMMGSNIEGNVNVTPMETEDGIVRLVPQTTGIEVTSTTIGGLINSSVSTIAPHINSPVSTITSINNPSASTSIPLTNLLIPPMTSLNNSSIPAITPLNNPPVSTIVTQNNTPVSTILPVNNTSVSTIPVTTTQQNIIIQQQQLQQLQQQQKQIQQPQLIQQFQQHQQQQQQKQIQQFQQQQQQQQQQQSQSTIKNIINADNVALLTKTRLRELVKEVDPNEQLEEDVEDLMLQISDDFVDELVRAACVFAKHRKSNIVEVKDVQIYLERYLNMWIPGFGTDELRPYKKAPITEAHKQRTALIKKVASKKY